LCKKPDAAQDNVPAEGLLAIRATEDWKPAFRCEHCGCVYTLQADKLVLRGYFNNPVVGGGWLAIHR
jgi:hypothetical protein